MLVTLFWPDHPSRVYGGKALLQLDLGDKMVRDSENSLAPVSHAYLLSRPVPSFTQFLNSNLVLQF